MKEALELENRELLQKLIRKQEVYRISGDQMAKILDIDWFRYKVKITEGPNEGLTGWVSSKLIEGK